MTLSKVRKAIRNPTKAREHLMKKPFIFIDKYLNYGTRLRTFKNLLPNG